MGGDGGGDGGGGGGDGIVVVVVGGGGGMPEGKNNKWVAGLYINTGRGCSSQPLTLLLCLSRRACSSIGDHYSGTSKDHLNQLLQVGPITRLQLSGKIRFFTFSSIFFLL